MSEYSANGLIQWYNRVKDSCGNNELLFKQKKEIEFANNG